MEWGWDGGGNEVMEFFTLWDADAVKHFLYGMMNGGLVKWEMNKNGSKKLKKKNSKYELEAIF